jgi:regulatory protein
MALRAKPKKLEAGELWDYALKALGQRAHSAAEIKQKLARRAARPADVAATMSKLREYGLADDRKFAESVAASRLHNQGLGAFRVLRDLQAKKVATGLASEAVRKVYSETDERQLIEAFLQRKYRNRDLKLFLKEQKNFAAVYRRLRTAGFSSYNTLAILKKYNQAADDWEEPPEEVNG